MVKGPTLFQSLKFDERRRLAQELYCQEGSGIAKAAFKTDAKCGIDTIARGNLCVKRTSRVLDRSLSGINFAPVCSALISARP